MKNDVYDVGDIIIDTFENDEENVTIDTFEDDEENVTIDTFEDDEENVDSLKQQLIDPDSPETVLIRNTRLILKEKILAAFEESHKFSDSILEKIESYSNRHQGRNFYFSYDSNKQRYTVINYPAEIFLESEGFSYAEKNQLKIAAVSALMLKEIDPPQKDSKEIETPQKDSKEIKNSLGVLVQYMHKEQIDGPQDAIDRKTLNPVVEFCKKFLFDFTNSVKSLFGANKKTLSFESMITYAHSCQSNEEKNETDNSSSLSKEIKNVWKSKY